MPGLLGACVVALGAGGGSLGLPCLRGSSDCAVLYAGINCRGGRGGLVFGALEVQPIGDLVKSAVPDEVFYSLVDEILVDVLVPRGECVGNGHGAAVSALRGCKRILRRVLRALGRTELGRQIRPLFLAALLDFLPLLLQLLRDGVLGVHDGLLSLDPLKLALKDGVRHFLVGLLDGVLGGLDGGLGFVALSLKCLAFLRDNLVIGYKPLADAGVEFPGVVKPFQILLVLIVKLKYLGIGIGDLVLRVKPCLVRRVDSLARPLLADGVLAQRDFVVLLRGD